MPFTTPKRADRGIHSSVSSSSDVLLVALRDGVLDAPQLDRVRAAAGDMRVVVTRDRAAIEELLPHVRVALGQFPHDLLPGAGRLAWFQQWGAGADWLLRHPGAAELPFVLTNTSGIHAVPISEHVFACLLAFARALPRALEQQARAEWKPVPAASLVELAGKTMLLVGVGAIGERVASLALAFGMRVEAVRNDARRPLHGAAAVHGQDALLDVLPNADAVVITAPLTAATRGMFGAEQFRAMKRSAYLVNIGRGATVVEADLVTALQDGELAGAALDVFEQEPLPVISPLWSMSNVIVTAHYSGATPLYAARALEIFLDNLKRFRAGEELVNVVDKRQGY